MAGFLEAVGGSLTRVGAGNKIMVMVRLKPSQKKGLSEYLNMVSVAALSAGVIGQLFVEVRDVNRAIFLGLVALVISSVLLVISMKMLGEVRI